MTFLSKINDFFNKQFGLMILKENITQTNLPYDKVGIFNAILNNQYEVSDSYIPGIPPEGENVQPDTPPNSENTATTTPKPPARPTRMRFDKPENMVEVPVEESEETEEFVEITEPEEPEEPEVITEEEPVENPPYVQGRDENMPVRVVIDGKERYLTYNVAVLEDYAISHSHIRKGCREGWYSDIPEIRAKAPEDRTEEEINKLAEFDTMIEYIVNIGVEYGVDPNFISAIIRKEIGYDGMLESWAYTVNGLGYMQLTTIAIKDMFMHPDKYGDGLAEVMESRGFDLHCPKDQRDIMVKKVMKLLKTNEDPEFNIRLGTIKLRRLLNQSHGDIQRAARNYNGNTAIQNGQEIRVIYAKKAKEYYDELTARSK